MISPEDRQTIGVLATSLGLSPQWREANGQTFEVWFEPTTEDAAAIVRRNALHHREASVIIPALREFVAERARSLEQERIRALREFVAERARSLEQERIREPIAQALETVARGLLEAAAVLRGKVGPSTPASKRPPEWFGR